MSSQELPRRFQELIADPTTSVLILTGAGISAESGVPTFRGPEGLWRQYRPEDLATPQAFARDPDLVWEWYGWRRERIGSCQPNPGHRALAELEGRIEEFLLVTQNVDGLHGLAGSKRVVELHGSIWRVRCLDCGREEEDRRLPHPEPPSCPHCDGMLRPAVVWFGEGLPREALARALEAALGCDLMLVVGTSSLVYPAAALAPYALQAGAYVVEVNPEATPLSSPADLCLRGPAGQILPGLFEPLSANGGSR